MSTFTPAEQIAIEFSRLLRAELTRDEMTAVRARNRASDNPHVCASHDFCDANMPMAAAFENLGIPIFGRDGRILDDSTSLWNEAWDIAKRNEFRARRTLKVSP